MEPVRGKATSKTKVVRHQRKVPKKEICKRMGPDSAKQELLPMLKINPKLDIKITHVSFLILHIMDIAKLSSNFNYSYN